MTDYTTSSPISAGTFGIPSTPVVPSTPTVPSSPVVPSSPCYKDEPMTGDQKILHPTPEGLSRRQYNLFKRNRKATLKAAKLMDQATEEMADATEDVTAKPSPPEGYKKGDFGRQARKLLKSADKHGMLSPGTHKVVKPAVVRYYSYKKDFKVAQRLAERKSRKNGGIRMM